MPSRLSRDVVSLSWNTSGEVEIPNGSLSHLYLPQDVCIVVIMDDCVCPKGQWRKPSRMSTKEKHFALTSRCNCSFTVGIWNTGQRIALLTAWLGSMHNLNFFGVSLMSSFEHRGGGSCTFAMIPASTYVWRAAFSLILCAIGTLWTGIWTGLTSSFTSKWTGCPTHPMHMKVSPYSRSTSPFRNYPAGAAADSLVCVSE